MKCAGAGPAFGESVLPAPFVRNSRKVQGQRRDLTADRSAMRDARMRFGFTATTDKLYMLAGEGASQQKRADLQEFDPGPHHTARDFHRPHVTFTTRT
eukprot:1975999-Rhodomonas_salina.3